MQCSCCRADCASLTEYSVAEALDRFRKTIQIINLCAVCAIVYRIKPGYIVKRIAEDERRKSINRRDAA